MKSCADITSLDGIFNPPLFLSLSLVVYERGGWGVGVEWAVINTHYYYSVCPNYRCTGWHFSVLLKNKNYVKYQGIEVWAHCLCPVFHYDNHPYYCFSSNSLCHTSSWTHSFRLRVDCHKHSTRLPWLQWFAIVFIALTGIYYTHKIIASKNCNKAHTGT